MRINQDPRAQSDQDRDFILMDEAMSRSDAYHREVPRDFKQRTLTMRSRRAAFLIDYSKTMVHRFLSVEFIV